MNNQQNFSNLENTNSTPHFTTVEVKNNLLSKIHLPTRKIAAGFVGIILSFVALFFGFKVFKGPFSRASDITPRDVVIREITESSAKIEWSTAIETQGVVEYGVSPSTLNFFAPESQRSKKHTIELTLLSPNTTYYFQIRIGDKVFDNAGVPWSFTTKSKQAQKEKLSPSPTLTPTPTKTKQITPTPTPYQSLQLGNPSPTTSQSKKSGNCNFTDCNEIKNNFGKGCTTQDYVKCIFKNKNTPTPTATASATQSL